MTNYQFSMNPNTTPVLVEGFLFSLSASSGGRPVLPRNTEPHAFELAMDRLESGMVSVHVEWSRVTFFATRLRAVLPGLANGPKALHREVLHMSGDEWLDRKKRARWGIDYMLSIDQPLTLGAADAEKLYEAARMAEAKRKDLINAMHALIRHHSS
jgi:hypothetical protein